MRYVQDKCKKKKLKRQIEARAWKPFSASLRSLDRVEKTLNYKRGMKDIGKETKTKGEVAWVPLPVPWRDRSNLSQSQLHLHEEPHCHLSFLVPRAECKLRNLR